MADSAALFDVGSDLQTIRGAITQIYHSANGFLIAKILVDPASRTAPDGKRRPSTLKVLGNMLEPKVRQTYEFTGKVEYNEQYTSHDMRFESYRTIMPDDTGGIFSYLVDTARWVGPSHAEQLIKAFGDKTLEVLKHEPDRVVSLGLSGLTVDRIREMADSLGKNEKLEAATIEVNNLLAGVLGPSVTRKAVKKWGCDAAAIIRSDPFQLTVLHGVGWHSADQVHKKLGREANELPRHKAALYHILSEAAGHEGHTLLPIVRVMVEGQKLVGGLRQDVFNECEKDESAGSDGITVCLGELNKAEKFVANKLITMLTIQADDTERMFPEISKDGLADDQCSAVDAFRFARVFALVGAPGTGKTYTLARIVSSLQSAGLQVWLCAPTGKAAKQMSLALAGTCGGEASTIHSLLAPTVDEESGEFRFSRDESCPLECDVLVVDELSMVDCRLMRSLLRAVRDTTRLLLVGDPYQLPSVGPGAVLRDLLRAGIPAFELKQIKRNAGNIVRACHAIKDGHSPRQFASGKLDMESGCNWRHIDAAGPEQIKAVIEILVRDKLPAMDINTFWCAQVISPTNEKGGLSCEALNKLLKPILNPAAKTIDKLPFGTGDKVVRLKNAVVRGIHLKDDRPLDDAPSAAAEAESVQDDLPAGQIRIVNGDIGIIREIDAKTITVDFRYPDRRAYIKRAEHELKLAYCMTCHKLQGSECQVVILPVHQSFAKMPMVSREWIYTAISRAKAFLITVGDLDAIDAIVTRVGMNQRQTTLARMLEQSLKKEIKDL